MKKTFIYVTLITAFTSSAYSADLYKFKHTDVVPQPYVFVQSEKDSYVGFLGGFNSFNRKYYSHFGLNVGHSWNKFFGTEITYLKTFKHDYSTRHDQLFGSALIQYNFDLFTPYIAVGPGYRWSSVGREEATYNLGPGLKYSINETIDFNSRYTYIRGVETGKKMDEHLFSTGLSIKF